jgi:hypothetical protein
MKIVHCRSADCGYIDRLESNIAGSISAVQWKIERRGEGRKRGEREGGKKR